MIKKEYFRIFFIWFIILFILDIILYLLFGLIGLFIEYCLLHILITAFIISICQYLIKMMPKKVVSLFLISIVLYFLLIFVMIPHRLLYDFISITIPSDSNILSSMYIKSLLYVAQKSFVFIIPFIIGTFVGVFYLQRQKGKGKDRRAAVQKAPIKIGMCSIGDNHKIVIKRNG